MTWEDDTAAIQAGAREAFGVTGGVTYYPKAGGSVVAYGVFRASGLQVSVGLEVDVESSGPQISALALADGTRITPVAAEKFLIRGLSYEVTRVVPDGEGDSIAYLHQRS